MTDTSFCMWGPFIISPSVKASSTARSRTNHGAKPYPKETKANRAYEIPITQCTGNSRVFRAIHICSRMTVKPLKVISDA
ncbi:hypothetical protein D3C73_1259290 [compost metagenome]